MPPPLCVSIPDGTKPEPERPLTCSTFAEGTTFAPLSTSKLSLTTPDVVRVTVLVPGLPVATISPLPTILILPLFGPTAPPEFPVILNTISFGSGKVPFSSVMLPSTIKSPQILVVPMISFCALVLQFEGLQLLKCPKAISSTSVILYLFIQILHYIIY